MESLCSIVSSFPVGRVRMSSASHSSMLSAKRKSDGQIVAAYFEKKSNGPFACLDCNEEVVLKTGRQRINHFAHANPIACKFATGESEEHRRCKLEIFHALQNAPAVHNVALERSLGDVRPDVSAGFSSGLQSSMDHAIRPQLGKSGFTPRILAACITGSKD
jgi:hypothetical protein